MCRVLLRRGGTWGPLLQCCKAYTWTNVSLSNKMLRKYKRLKTTAITVHTQLGQVLYKRYKKGKKPQLPALKSSEQNQGVGSESTSYTCPLHTAPTKG